MLSDNMKHGECQSSRHALWWVLLESFFIFLFFYFVILSQNGAFPKLILCITNTKKLAKPVTKKISLNSSQICVCAEQKERFGRPLGPAYQINRDCTYLCNTNTYHPLHPPQLRVLVTMPKGTRGLAFTARRRRQLCGSEGGGSLAATLAAAA